MTIESGAITFIVSSLIELTIQHKHTPVWLLNLNTQRFVTGLLSVQGKSC